MRVAVLHTRLSGYLAACLRELKHSADAQILIFTWPLQADAPFDASHFKDIGQILNREDHSKASIFSTLRKFKPDVVLTSGWVDKGYLAVCKKLRKDGVPVVAGCDTQWTGSLRQYMASWLALWHIQQAIDVLWVTGERQSVLARSLGYRGSRLWEGYYACDWNRFSMERPKTNPIAVEHDDLNSKKPNHERFISITNAEQPFFLYVGRYVKEKGLDTLARAYGLYKDQVTSPWQLVCAGSGPLRDMLLDVGAIDVGFIQPNDLPNLMACAGAFILPSRFEPWGVVVQEAAASSLPLICSDACGAAVHLLKDQYNGFLVPNGDVRALKDAMVSLSQMNTESHRQFGKASFELSKQYTPTRWAETLVRGLEHMMSKTNRGV